MMLPHDRDRTAALSPKIMLLPLFPLCPRCPLAIGYLHTQLRQRPLLNVPGFTSYTGHSSLPTGGNWKAGAKAVQGVSGH